MKKGKRLNAYDGSAEFEKIDEKSRKEHGYLMRWIPVSERLPEERCRILVTTDNMGERKVYTGMYYDGRFHPNYCGDVVAWMPKPMPYTEG